MSAVALSVAWYHSSNEELCLSFDQKPAEVANRHVPQSEIPEFHIKHVDHLGLPPNDVSTAVSIYPYIPQRDDEMKISVGENFTILDRSTGWMLIEKDKKSGWVPSGCLSETSHAQLGELLNGKGIIAADYESLTPVKALVKKGDIVAVRRQDVHHWLQVELSSSAVVWIPSCHVSILESQSDDKKADMVCL